MPKALTITAEAELVGLRTVGRVVATTLQAMARAMQADTGNAIGRFAAKRG